MELSLRSPFLNAKILLQDVCSRLVNKLIACTNNNCSVSTVENLYYFLAHSTSGTPGLDRVDRIFVIYFARAFD